jgi:putative salt-induced outer membrane protein
MYKFIALAFAIFLSVAQAQEKSPWAHESEASVVQVSGNTESESYSAKQKTVYTVESNMYTATGRYLQTKAGSVETARAWDAGLRYDRMLTEKWSAFAAHGAESDRFANIIQRDNTDLGGTYFFDKDDTQVLKLEASYRATHNTKVASASQTDEAKGVLNLEWNRKLNASTSAYFKAKYQHNFTETKFYLVDYEPGVTVMMSEILSLKVSYLSKYQNEPGLDKEGNPLKKEDRSLTTSLVAKF